MSSHVAILCSLGLALFLSPETLVLGLIIASDRKAPRLAARMYALGGLLGIAFALAVGVALSPEMGPPSATAAATVTAAHAWRRCLVRAVLAAMLLTIGVRRTVNAVEDTPIAETSAQERRSSRAWRAFSERFPSAAHLLDPASDLPRTQVGLRGVLAGFAMCGLHPKIFPVAVAAGHQLEQMPARVRLPGALLFIVIAAGATITPAILESLRQIGRAHV